MGSPGKSVPNLLTVAKLYMKAQIAWKIIPHTRRMLSEGIITPDHGWQHLVVDHNGFGSVARLQLCFCHDHRQRLANMTYFVHRKR